MSAAVEAHRWRLEPCARHARCCACDREIAAGVLVATDSCCVFCVGCSGHVLASIEVEVDDREHAEAATGKSARVVSEEVQIASGE